MHDLAIPSHLQRTKGDAGRPRHLRWKRMRAQRPDGSKWEGAERWEIKVPGGGRDPKSISWCGSGLAAGTRLVWAIIGRKWVELRDNEGYAKVPRAEWDEITRYTGRKVS
jgi:hypothetical protein